MEKVKCSQCSKTFVNQGALDEHKASAHPAMLSDEELDRAAKQSLWEYMTSDGNDKGLRERAKIAAGHRATEAKREQTKGANVATMYQMARDLATDKTQLAEYLRVAVPTAPVLKALPAKQ